MKQTILPIDGAELFPHIFSEMNRHNYPNVGLTIDYI